MCYPCNFLNAVSVILFHEEHTIPICKDYANNYYLLLICVDQFPIIPVL